MNLSPLIFQEVDNQPPRLDDYPEKKQKKTLTKENLNKRNIQCLPLHISKYLQKHHIWSSTIWYILIHIYIHILCVYIAWVHCITSFSPPLTLGTLHIPSFLGIPNGGKPQLGKASLRRETSGGDTTCGSFNSNENGGFKTSKRSETVKPTMNSNYTTENQPTIKPESSEKRLHWPSFIIGSSKKRLYPPRKLTAGTHTPCAPSPTLVNPTPLRHDLKQQVKFNVLLHPRNTREGLSRNWFRGIPLKSAWNTPPIGHMHTHAL